PWPFPSSFAASQRGTRAGDCQAIAKPCRVDFLAPALFVKIGPDRRISMDANPVLAETLRGNWVENRHRGAYAVIDAEGRVIASRGDIDRPIFPRSAIKSMQALPIFTQQADARFDLADEELALACASHHGEEAHVAGVQDLLSRMGLSVTDLE